MHGNRFWEKPNWIICTVEKPQEVQPPNTMKYKVMLGLGLLVVMLLSFGFHQTPTQFPNFRILLGGNCKQPTDDQFDQPRELSEQPTDHLPGDLIKHFPEAITDHSIRHKTETQRKVNEIFHKINQLMPKVTFTNVTQTTSGQKSKAIILNPKNKYCVGDHVTVQVDVYDYLGNRKKFGGDVLRARIFSPELGASASGTIDDLNNGTYLANFTLFWEGKVQVSVMLIHPSEAASALWKRRNQGYILLDFTGKFTNLTQQVQVKCGFQIDTKEELCQYMDARDDEFFYCIKPKELPCGAFTELMSKMSKDSYLTDLEYRLVDRSNIRVEIPRSFEYIDVVRCQSGSTAPKEKCKTGFKYQFPGGYFLQNVWKSLSCNVTAFDTAKINACLNGKLVYMIGDSTMLQWLTFLTSSMKTLKNFNLYTSGWPMTRLLLDMEQNIKIEWRKHGLPFIMLGFYTSKEDQTITQQIDQIPGDQHTVITFTLGMHFRLFPLHLYIRRVLNIRKAIERLFLRSPETKVIIKTENTSDMYEKDYGERVEMTGDFHGYVQYMILNEIFQGMNVGVVDAWDMTTAFNSNNIHPPPIVIQSEINLLLSYIC